MLKYLFFIIPLLCSSPIFAQKGMEEKVGIARSGITREIINLTGTVEEIKMGPCESSTGRGREGIHLIIRDSTDTLYNIHLGPFLALRKKIHDLDEGDEISIEAFQKEDLDKNHLIAKSLSFGITTLHLRDENLKPLWSKR